VVLQCSVAAVGDYGYNKISGRHIHEIIAYVKIHVTSYRPGGGETICPRPMAVRLAADLRPSADGSAVRTWLSCTQPACL